ncbi:SDR family oxidoreductase [Sphingomonas pruni]|uniref:SDR family oxidoreductase n=1 Tax=Sphingomonas pruni TaxID=40683 RepID=UPI000832A0B0|nr:SDR family oxidoreductase [Sphingomonas pruni]
MKYKPRYAPLATCLLAAVPAHASDKTDFAGCDGLEQPGRQEDGMRGAASASPFASASIPAITIGTCSRALASPRLLPTQKLRQANLLRARAAAFLQSSNPAAALKDIDAASAVTADQANDPFFARSMPEKMPCIRVNVLSPGPVHTPGLVGLVGDDEMTQQGFLKHFAALIPLGRVGTPEEIGRAALFLASDDSSFVNGAELFADGGIAQV